MFKDSYKVIIKGHYLLAKGVAETGETPALRHEEIVDYYLNEIMEDGMTFDGDATNYAHLSCNSAEIDEDTEHLNVFVEESDPVASEGLKAHLAKRLLDDFGIIGNITTEW